MNASHAAVSTAHAGDGATDIEALARLFDAYRIFYEREPDPESAKRYIGKRLRGGGSHFIKALAQGRIVGFAHLSETLDTLSMRDAWFLEDLFVDPDYRRRGVGSALLRHAERFARDTHGSRLSLFTARTNLIAQALYEANGYVRDDAFYLYQRDLGS
jgi:ribosomal protein S18 acetylase RimI-like enzyme